MRKIIGAISSFIGGNVNEILFCAGSGILLTGLWWERPSAALIVGGVGLVFLGWLGATRKGDD